MQGSSSGGGVGFCSGPFSWWCSEVLHCSPKVVPGSSGPGADPSPMAECEHCGLRFNLLRRRRECAACHMVYCGACLKRGVGGTRRCNKCVVLTQWPLDMAEVTALKVKDLRQFLHSQRISTSTCTEKRDLIDLVTRHVSSKHRSSTGHQHCHQSSTTATDTTTPSQRHTATAPNRNHSHNNTRHKATPQTPTGSQQEDDDDGIRVRPSSNSSIRVRPLDSIRVRPGCPVVAPDLNTDTGIRVFASEQDTVSENSPSTSPLTSPMSDYGGDLGLEEEQCSRCPSNDSTSCYSLHCRHHQPDCSSQNSSDWVLISDPNASSTPSSEGQGVRERNDEVPGDTFEPSAPPLHQQEGEEEQEEGEVEERQEEVEERQEEVETDAEQQQSSSVPPSTTSSSSSSSSSVSSSAATSAVSSPEPAKGVVAGIVALDSLKSEEEIQHLSVRQCKELLSLHRVTYAGVREKSELVSKIKILWEDYRASRQELENLPEELICKICMDSKIDCVLLECGHMVSCTQCGKQMSECPLCRQYVVRVVRTFRA